MWACVASALAFMRTKSLPCTAGCGNSTSGLGTFANWPILRAMDAMTLNRWIPFRNDGAVVRCRIFSFPHAAGSAAYYRPLRRIMPPEIDLCPVELPGRAARLDERPLTSMSAVMERLRVVLRPLMTIPFGFFGHSVGAWTAYEAARQLRSVDGRNAVHLFVSGRGSPSAPADQPPQRPRSDHELLAVLNRFGGTPQAIMQRPELIAALLPALRADLALAERYAVDLGHRLTCPITAFGGADDNSGSGSLHSWRDFTRGEFRTCIFPGGHFYFSPAAEALAREIIHDLHASAGPPAPAARSQT
jgi:surfactin synthase thioesterase subunit